MDQAINLRKMMRKKQSFSNKSSSKVITVTSGKGGVGKSNVSVNLAINFKKKGKRVVIFDADFGLANIEVIFGIIPKYNLFDLIYNGMKIEEVLTSGPLGIEFISGGSGVQELINLSKDQLNFLNEKLLELDHLADIIIIDTGAGISDSVLDFIVSSNEVILVTTPEPTSITDAYAVLKALKNRKREDYKSIDINLLVNRVSNESEGLEIYNKLNKVTNKFLGIGLNNIGFLPQDSYLTKAVIKQKPVSILYPSSKVSKAFEVIANNLLNHSTYKAKQDAGLRSVFYNLMKSKKNK
ncbi:MinD/ParA family protein [Vallitalea sp.]|jgi:flagellar biosynthesis protein FlhG|uniref:MinD/ParA family protein n=1 Tax=Vallitalea sp. TaxID=1882829 RepID=UPI0025CD5752|nr:MinD/ParA family protein [Vallitalea sp.]MCT4688245.1 MinD/ParA family protein [Vallitalea sp.]